ncbi:MAG TPA: metallophosphoesterase [Actinomycetales bacterium]|jgi:predicted MPP superfamily phosphohydrolase
MVPTRSFVVGALGTVAATGVAGLAYAVAESRAYTLRRYDLPVLPAGAPPLRVLQVTDLHLTPRNHAEVAFIRRLAALEPDLVVDTGDNLAHLQAVPTALHALGPLLERPGVFVLGSNDYFAPTFKNPARYLANPSGRKFIGTPLPTDELVRGFTSAGWLDLTNRRATLTVNGIRLAFVGVDDPHLGRDRYPLPGPETSEADLTIGVTHAPYTRVLDTMATEGLPLVLAGHTHGGQLRIPGYGALVTNCDLDTLRCRGVSRWWTGAGRVDPRTPAPDDATWLHVSAGLGTSPFTPVRVACRPEASLLTLTAAT